MPIDEIKEKKALSVELNLFLLGFALVWGKGRRTFEIWFGPWGVLLKLTIILMKPETFLLRLGLDLGRGYIASASFEISQAAQGLGQHLEILVGPFGYLIRFVQKLHLQPNNNLFLWVVRLGPDGVLFASKFRLVKNQRLLFSIEESLGPFKSLARIAINLEWRKLGPANWDAFVQVGPRGYVLQANLSVKRSVPKKSRVYLSGNIGPGGAVLKLLIGMDFSTRPLRPFFELTLGPGDKYGFLYRHSGKDKWINGLDLAKKSDRILRIIGFDMFALAHRESEVSAMVVEGVSGFLAPPVNGVKLRVYIDGKYIQKARTDENGWAQFKIGSMKEGNYKIAFTRSKRGVPKRSGVARLTVLGENKRVVALRLEDMLATGWETAFGRKTWKDISVAPEISRLMFELAQSSEFIYLTRLPVEYMAAARRNLFKSRHPLLPRGMLLPSKITKGMAKEWTLPFPSHDDVEPKMVEWLLKEARYRGAAVLYGVSHLESDLRMVENAAINAIKIPILENGEGDMDALALSLGHLLIEEIIQKDMELAKAHIQRRREADGQDFTHKIFLIESMTGKRPVSFNGLSIKTNPGDIVPDIFCAIDNADKAICISTMMLGADQIGNKVTDKLIAAAKRGVAVRIMVDQWLSEHSEAFPNFNIDRLSKGLVKVQVRKLAHGFARVHKKTITVLNNGKAGAPDSLLAFVGGMNWVNASFGNYPENLGDIKLENPERDIFSRLEGQVAIELQKDFLNTWEWVSKKMIPKKEKAALMPVVPKAKRIQGDPFSAGEMFVIGSIPDRDSLISDAFLALIASAKNHICIEQNFPPSRSILEALAKALDRGVKIDWVFGTRKGASSLLVDKINLNKAAMLFEKGADISRKYNPVRVRIYPITVHMKAMTIDSEILYYGTANLDQVSVDEDAETMIIIPDPSIARWFEDNIFNPDFYKGTEVKWNAINHSLVINGEEENHLDRVNRVLVDVILPDQIQ